MIKKSSILRSTIWVTLLILVGKCFGFIREALIAAYYGSNAQTDAFFFAQGMPSMIFPAVGNSLALAFTSIYVSRITTEGEELADVYASRMLTASLVLGILLGITGVILAPFLVPVLAPGFSGTQLDLAIHLTQLTMGAFAFVMAQYMLSAILNSKSLFIGSQVAGLIYNTSIIGITIVLGNQQGMEILTLTVIAGMALQVMALAICCHGRFQYKIFISPFHQDTINLFHFALPIFLGNSIVQINNIVDKALASTLESGSLSALSYAGSLNTMVISVFVMSISTVLYPSLANDATKGDFQNFGKNLVQSLSGLSLILIPISCITILSAKNIVSIVFARGQFDETAIKLTSTVLICYAPRFIFAGIREVLSRGFFALQDTKTPMVNGSVGVCCNIVFSLLLVRYLGIAGIACGTTISSIVIAVLLFNSAHRKIKSCSLKFFLGRFGKQLISGGMLVLAVLQARQVLNLSSPFYQFVFDTIIGFISYFGMLLVVHSEDMLEIFAIIKRKVFKQI